jgi:hypothetical protein
MFAFDHDKFSPCHVAVLLMDDQSGSALYELVEGRQFEEALNRLQDCPKEARYRQHGWTPLHLLCWIMHHQEEGAGAGSGSGSGLSDVSVSGTNPITIGGGDAHNSIAVDETQTKELPQILALAEALLEAYPSAVWDDGMGGETPLDVAVIHGSVPLLTLLIDKHPSCMDPTSVHFVPAWERAWRHLVGRTVRHRLARQREQQSLMHRQEQGEQDDDVIQTSSTSTSTVLSNEETDTMEHFVLDLHELMTSKEKGNTICDPSNSEQALLWRIWDNVSFLLCQASSSKLGCGCVKDDNSRDRCDASAWSLVLACLTVGCCAPDLFRFAIMMSSHHDHDTPLDQDLIPNTTTSTDVDGNTPLHLLICSQTRCALRTHATWGVRASKFNHVEFLLQFTNNENGTSMPCSVSDEEEEAEERNYSTMSSRRHRRVRQHQSNQKTKMTAITNNKGELALHMALKRQDRNWWQTRIATVTATATACATAVPTSTSADAIGSTSTFTTLGEGHATARALLAADPWTGTIADGATGHLPFVLAACNMCQEKTINPQDSSSNNRSSAEDEIIKDATTSAQIETLFQLLGACPELKYSTKMMNMQ